MQELFGRRLLFALLCLAALFALALVLYPIAGKSNAQQATGAPAAKAIASAPGWSNVGLCASETCALDDECVRKCATIAETVFPVAFAAGSGFGRAAGSNVGEDERGLFQVPGNSGKCGAPAVFYSRVLDAGKETDFGNIGWSFSGSPDFSVSVRTGDFDGNAIAWSAWSENLFDGVSAASAVPGEGRLFQFRLFFREGRCARIESIAIGEREKITVKPESIGGKSLPKNLDESNLESRYGVNNHISSATLGALSKAGFGWVRDDMPWQEIEQAKGKKLVPEKIDRYISNARDFGMHVLPVLSYGTAWWAAESFNPQSFADFAGFVAAKYRFGYYEIWNEENLGRFWEPWFNEPPNPKRYAAIFKAASARIKSVEPDAKIIVGGTVGADANFIGALFGEGIADYADVVAFHPYRSACPIEEYLGDFTKLRETVEARTDKRIGYWITEVGYQTKENGRVFALDEESQAKMLARVMLFTLSLPIEKVFWYDSADSDSKDGEDNFYGLLGRDGRPKESYRAAATIISLLKNAAPVNASVAAGKPENLEVHLFSVEDRLYLAAWYFYGCEKARGIMPVRPIKATVELGSPDYLAPTQINIETGERTPLYYTRLSNGIAVDIAISDMPILIELSKAGAA
ncbi:MAG: hypothetical protein HY394_02790 [Candidatus Diapherotrites archaeon]|nr:hypothetical protein [Candidatus Diapherotrites archaeon]